VCRQRQGELASVLTHAAPLTRLVLLNHRAHRGQTRQHRHLSERERQVGERLGGCAENSAGVKGRRRLCGRLQRRAGAAQPQSSSPRRWAGAGGSGRVQASERGSTSHTCAAPGSRTTGRRAHGRPGRRQQHGRGGGTQYGVVFFIGLHIFDERTRQTAEVSAWTTQAALASRQSRAIRSSRFAEKQSMKTIVKAGDR